MFRKLIRKYNYIKLRSQNNSSNNNNSIEESIPNDINALKDRLKNIFSECSDFIIRDIIITKLEIKASFVYIDGLLNNELVESAIIRPLMNKLKLEYDINNDNVVEIIRDQVVSVSKIKNIYDLNKAVNSILSGYAVLFFDGASKALEIDVSYFNKRNVDEPESELIIRGPREGFIEDLRTNTTLIRRKVKNPNLKFESLILGRNTNTEVNVCYIKGIAKEEIVSQVKERLKQIKTDAILESGYIEEFIEDAPLSIFPTVGNTEKPDVVAAKLLEGRVAILCDGTPFVLTVPYLFIESMQVSEDYYSRFAFSSFIRLLRMLAFIISILAPAIYIALISYHHDIIPFKLMLTMASSRKGVPFHPFLEAIIMTLVFELLREAGTRMPKPVGQAISIVGALVLGQAAVEAGLVSNLMIIVIAITSLTSFIITPLNGTVPIIRILFMIGANTLGLIGIFIVAKFLIVHMCMIESFGTPYMYPYTPMSETGIKDTFVRFPIWSRRRKPEMVVNNNLDFSQSSNQAKEQ